jgi:hypothetical protein
MNEVKYFKILEACLWLLIFIVAQNCQTMIVYPDKEGKFSNVPIKVENKDSEIPDFTKYFQSGGDIAFYYDIKTGHETGWYSLAQLNLCLIIPCIETYNYFLDVEYHFEKKKISSEKYTGKGYLIITPFLLPYSIFYLDGFYDRDDHLKIKEKISHHIISNIQEGLRNAEKKKDDLLAKRKSTFQEFSRLNKSRCSGLYNFREENFTLLSSEQNVEISNEFNECIERKVLKTTSEKYPFLQSHWNKEIFFRNFSSTYFLKDLFNAKFLSINPETEYKLTENEFYFSEKDSNSFVMHILHNGNETEINFQIINSKLYCVSIVSGYEKNPDEWEYLVQAVFKILFTLPKEKRQWDWAWINRN